MHASLQTITYLRRGLMVPGIPSSRYGSFNFLLGQPVHLIEAKIATNAGGPTSENAHHITETQFRGL